MASLPEQTLASGGGGVAVKEGGNEGNWR